MPNDDDIDTVPLYLTPLRKSGADINDFDDDGLLWGFTEYAELLIENTRDTTAINAHAKELDALAKSRLIVRWCRAAPYPHYRVTRMRYMELVKAGVQVVGYESAEVLRKGWVV